MRYYLGLKNVEPLILLVVQAITFTPDFRPQADGLC